jgi:ribosomal protein L32
MKQNIALIFIVIVCAISLTESSAFAHRWCWSCNQDNTYGWQLMTSEERKDHQAKLARFTEYNTCKKYIDSHRTKMEGRAREKGIDLPVVESDPCDALKAKGILK